MKHNNKLGVIECPAVTKTAGSTGSSSSFTHYRETLVLTRRGYVIRRRGMGGIGEQRGIRGMPSAAAARDWYKNYCQARNRTSGFRIIRPLKPGFEVRLRLLALAVEL